MHGFNTTYVMWNEVEILLNATFASAGYVELSLAFILICWIFSARVVAMMELMSTKLFETYDGSIKQSSSSLHHQLTQYQLRKREQIAQARNSTLQTFESALYSLKETGWNINLSKERRPVVGLSCSDCCPQSRKTLPFADSLPVVNIFNTDTYNRSINKGLLSFFSTIRHCLTFKKYHFPYIYDSVLAEENIRDVIEQTAHEEAQEHGISDPEGIAFFVEKQKGRAVQILKTMHSTLSDTVIRIVAWIFYKTLPLLFTSMSVPKGQIDMLKKAASSGIPLIFLPLHRSHVDYIAVTFILCNSGIRSPLVAAGENLRIPFFGWILRCLGAFFIKRRIDPVSGKKDKLYRAVLHNYMTHSLQAGHYFEFFIEGGRTRTGKPCMPKGGLMSVFVDAYLSGILEDAYLVPVSINYDKIVEGNFISELTGEPKKPESFFSTLQAMWNALTSHYGLLRVDFNQPFSLHELVRSFQNKVMNSGGSFHIAPSTASLYGTDIINEEQRQLVDSITRHILYDCSRSTAVMSTNALAFLLLNCYRSGATLSELTYALDRLRDELTCSKKDTGFSGESKDVIEHAIKLLGPGLIQVEKTENDKIFKPITVLPNVLELSYYSNTLIAHFCLEGVVGRTLLCLTAEQENAKVTLDRVIDVSVTLCEILQFEFIFTKTCQMLNNVIFDVLDNMATHDLITKMEIPRLSGVGYPRNLEIIDDDDEDEDYVHPTTNYLVNRSEEKLQLYGRMLEPLIDVYCLIATYLPKLAGRIVAERCLHKELLAVVKEYVDNGSIRYAESLSIETVKNCIRVLEKWKVLNCHIEDGTKLYYLNSRYDDTDLLMPIINRVDQFKHC